MVVNQERQGGVVLQYDERNRDGRSLKRGYRVAAADGSGDDDVLWLARGELVDGRQGGIAGGQTIIDEDDSTGAVWYGSCCAVALWLPMAGG